MQGFTLWNNSISLWFYAVATGVLVFFITRFTKALLLKRLKKKATDNENSWYAIVAKILERIHFLFLLAAAVYAGALILSLPSLTARVLGKAFFIVVLLQIGRLATQAIKSAIELYRRQQLQKNAEAVTMLSAVSFLLRMLLWTILVLMVLGNFGVDITALVAGLGVGGVAVALAVQNILGDIFASFSIVLDKPFVIGDFIITSSRRDQYKAGG
jgi:small-conductance mechanosensitive channel